MSDALDDWPDYNPHQRRHLHALGVISVAFNSFEQGLFRLYAHHPQIQKLPYELVQLYYASLNEQARPKAISTVFKQYEKEDRALAVCESLITYFNWSWDARNKLLHSELYPALFGGDGSKLYLIKPKSKKEPEPAYMALTLNQLRETADQIEFGKRQCSAFIIYLRCRDIPANQLPRGYLAAFEREGLPELLVTPPHLEIYAKPHDEPPPHIRNRRKRSS